MLFSSSKTPSPELNEKVWQVKVYSGGHLIHVGRLEIHDTYPPARSYWTGDTVFSYCELETNEWVTVAGTLIVETVARNSPRPTVFTENRFNE